jgi:hypothetical protein
MSTQTVGGITKGRGPGDPAFDNLDPILQQIATNIFVESGGRVWIGSGWRSIQQQASLYNAWQAGDYDVPRVARPGTSQHNHGRAIDFDGDLRLAKQLGAKYGLVFPMDDEPWHGQLGGDAGGGAEMDGQLGIQYNLAYGGGKPVPPEEVLANRMNSIMSLIGGDEFSSGAQQFVAPTDQQAVMSGQLPAEAPDMSLPEAGNRVSRQFMLPEITGTNPQNTQVSFQPAGDKSQLGAYAQSLFQQFGFKPEDYPALVWLWNKESGDPSAGSNVVTWDPLAQNPNSTAFGIAQFLNGTWQGTGIAKTANPQQQIMAGLTYIKGRYGNPRNALNFHMRNNWY